VIDIAPVEDQMQELECGTAFAAKKAAFVTSCRS
jgi:hypothetical protein